MLFHVRRCLLVLVAAVFLAAGVSSAQESIKIGVLSPLSTATFAQAGQEQRRGYLMALEEINARGGVLGRRLELVFEDTKGDPATAIAAMEKLINRDRVVAIVGGYSSTVSYAVLGAMRRYRPLVAWIGASSVKVEEEFGQEDWFFHYHPWDYDRQRTVRDFLTTIRPRPERVGIAYEDGLYGTTSRDYAVQYLREARFNVIFDESFKSGSADFTALLTRASGRNPDVFYVVGYAGDYLTMLKQAREVGFSPKLFFIVAPNFPGYWEALGKTGDYVAGVDLWVPFLKVPGIDAFMQRFRQLYPDRERPEYWVPLAYVNLMTVADAIERAGTTDTAALISAMKQTDYQSVMGRITFAPSEKAKHHALRSMIVTQWQGGEIKVVYPDEFANAKLVYPVPRWNER